MFVRKLIARFVASLIVPEAAAIYVSFVMFPFSPEVLATVQVVLPTSLLVATIVASASVVAVAGPIGSALQAGPALEEAARRKAALAAARLPEWTSVIVVAVGLLCTAVAVATELRRGVPGDVALAAVGVGLAFTIMASMSAYSVAGSVAAPAVAELGSGELRGGRTIRGKVRVLCFGTLASAAVLFLSVSYATFRADTDQDQLNEAITAQEQAARALDERGYLAAAELVYRATGAPTAVVARDGDMLAHVGESSESPALRLSEGAVTAVPGGWIVRHVEGDVSIISSVADALLRQRRWMFFARTLAFGAALLASAGTVVWLGAAGLTAPIGLLGSAAARVASGDLTVSPPSLSRDETGRLAADFRSMAKGLSGLVTDVKEATRGVEEGAREMGGIGQRVQVGAREEHERVVAMGSAVGAMHASVDVVGSGVEGLADDVRSTSAVVAQMATSLEEVRRRTGELEKRMEAARSDVDRLSQAGRRAQGQIEGLETLAQSAQRTLGAVSDSVSGLEMSAVGGQLAAAQAAELADRAGGVVKEAAHGIESLRSAVDDAKRRVTVLGRRSDDIDKIIDFIGEVAGRTNLLSLNASIIATQAGEHGKAFGVVADQIRDLAAQISASTKSIGEIIRAARDDVSGTARLIERGDALAATGVELMRGSLDALRELRVATFKGHETSAAIRNAVQEHAQSTQDASELVSSIADSADALSEAIQLVGKIVVVVGAVSRGAGELGDEIGRALAEQSSVGQRQLESLERIDGMLSEIKRAVATHEQSSARVRDALSHLERTAIQHEGAVVELSAVAGRLEGRSKALAERVGRFKI